MYAISTMDDEKIKKLEERLEERTRELIKRSVELDEAKAKGETVLEGMADGVIATGKDRNIILINNAGENLLGWKADELLGKKWPEVINVVDERHNRISTDALPAYQVTATGRSVSTGTKEELYFTKKDGTHFPVAITASPIRVQGALRGVVEVFRDITREKELDKIQSDFISVASHQLRTPITGIAWVIERFLKKETLSPSGQSYLKDIYESVGRLSRLIDALLNVSRIEGGGVAIIPEPFDAVTFISDYLKDARPLLETKRLRLSFLMHPESLHIVSDRNTLQNILQSIVTNAIEYTPAGGSIILTLEKKEGTFVIAVSDTGIGIPKDEQANIFNKFIRGTNATLVKTDGTGLGLYIARQAVRLLGGKIWFVSEEGKGTTFYIELPTTTQVFVGSKKLA